jgi:hypothetical protein
VGAVVIELALVVTLAGLNGENELSGHPGKEVEESGERLKLGMQRESPRVMGEIINHHEIVFITRRCPEITMHNIEGMHRMRRRKR